MLIRRRHGDQDTEGEHKPGFHIAQSLHHLLHQKIGLVTTLMIPRQSQCSYFPFPRCKTPRRVRPTRHSKEEHTPVAEVIAPQMMNSVLQGASERLEFFSIPYIKSAPTICARPLMVIQVPVRMGCSDLRYQIEDIVTKAGETAPSQKPRRKRTVAKPA